MEPSENHLDNTCTTYRESTKSRKHFTGEITLRVAQIVNIDQLQHYIP